MKSAQRWTRIVLSLTSLLLSGAAHLWAQPPANSQTVTLDHRAGIQNPVATFELRKGDTLHVEVTHTNLACFEFNQKLTREQQGANDATERARLDDKVEFNIIHDGVTVKYSIEAKKRADAGDDCNNIGLSEKTWDIQVSTYGWTLAFAGAFTIDELTDPVFSLTPTTRPGTMGDTVDGFTVSVDKGAESRYKLGAAAMVHLYHSDPNFLGRNGIAWAPLSFGLGVGDNSQARYFLGTTVRFDTRLFLTLGRAFGSVNRLPNGLQVGSFTTDSNSLGTLGSRTDNAWFIGLSYSFIDVNRDSFQAPFKQTNPSPE